MRKTSVFLCLMVVAILLAAWPVWSDPSATDAGVPQATQSKASFTYFSPDVDDGGHGLPFVQLELDGHTNATFVIDSGTSECILTDALATKLGLTPQPYMRGGQRVTDVHGRPANCVMLPSLKLGTIEIDQMTFEVMPEKEIRDFSPETTGHVLDGFIGVPFLQQFTTFFDFPNRQITFWYPAGLTDAQRQEVGFGNTLPIPLSDPEELGIYGTNVAFSEGNLKAQEFLEFDTGAQITTVLPHLVHQLHLLAGPISSNSTMKGAVGTRQAVVGSLSIGQMHITNQTLTFPSDDDGRLPVSLGMDVLSRYRVLFDLQHQQMYITPGLASVSATVPISAAQLDLVKLRSLVKPPPVSISFNVNFKEPSSLTTEVDNRPLSVRLLALRRRVQLKPDDAFGWQLLAEIERQMNQNSAADKASGKAVSLYQSQVRLHPKDGLILAHLGDALNDLNRTEEAEAISKRSVTLVPGNWLGWAVLGEVHEVQAYTLLDKTAMSSRGQKTFVSTTGDSDFQKILARLQKNPPAPPVLAKAARLSKLGEEELDRAVGLAPNNPLPYLHRDGNFESHFTQSLLQALQKQHVDSLLPLNSPEMLADTHMVAKLEPGSIAAVSTAIFVDMTASPTGISFPGASGDAHASAGMPTPEGDDLQIQKDRLIALTHSRDVTTAASAFSMLGYLQAIVLHDSSSAEGNLRKAIALDATQEPAWQGLILLLAQQERSADMIDVIHSRMNRAVDPASALNHLLLARAEYKRAVQNKTDPDQDAEVQVRAAMRLNPHDLEASLTLAALLLIESDHRPSAISEAGKLLPPLPPAGTPPDLSAQYALTRSLYLALAGQPAQALPIVTAILQADPDNEDAKNILAALQPEPLPAP